MEHNKRREGADVMGAVEKIIRDIVSGLPYEEVGDIGVSGAEDSIRGRVIEGLRVETSLSVVDGEAPRYNIDLGYFAAKYGLQ
jgi:hypothetical protein